jgi:hypothetical protein
MHLRPEADRFFREVERLRSEGRSRDYIKGTANTLYPDGSASPSTLAAKRARFMTACTAPAERFARGKEVYLGGGNLNEAVRAIGPSSSAGAGEGNLNARGKRKKHSLDRINGLWRALSRDKQNQFLRQHNLLRAD